MSTAISQQPCTGNADAIAVEAMQAAVQVRAFLQRWFDAEFALLDGQTGEPIDGAPSSPVRAWEGREALCAQVARLCQPELIAEEGSIVALAVPLARRDGSTWVALGLFVIGDDSAIDLRPGMAGLLDPDGEPADQWLARQPRWTADALMRLARAASQQWQAEYRLGQLQQEVQKLSLSLSGTYEEISLLHRLTQNLKLSSSDEELGRLVIVWLTDILPAEAIVVRLSSPAGDDLVEQGHRPAPLLLCEGKCPIGDEEFCKLLRHLQLDSQPRPVILNASTTEGEGWPLSAVRQIVITPLWEGDNVFGWLSAINHAEDGEFGSVEASMLCSVAAILGIHCGNTELYQQQKELLTGVIRALSSAIDAKDPYTCGHSDRVARISVRLGRELGLTTDQLNTIYLSGLLHDVGKIGIDDNVLRKPGRLTGPEYEHIKTHAQVGYRILQDIKQFDELLPVVLHHHEQWDGHGYPRSLVGLDIPLFARIVAVADAFDAMGSDRPYRHGMPEERVDAILREGAGTQWDPTIVDCFFAARDDIRAISAKERENLALDVQQWM